jgi:hypothetical protein
VACACYRPESLDIPVDFANSGAAASSSSSKAQADPQKCRAAGSASYQADSLKCPWPYFKVHSCIKCRVWVTACMNW